MEDISTASQWLWEVQVSLPQNWLFRTAWLGNTKWPILYIIDKHDNFIAQKLENNGVEPRPHQSIIIGGSYYTIEIERKWLNEDRRWDQELKVLYQCCILIFSLVVISGSQVTNLSCPIYISRGWYRPIIHNWVQRFLRPNSKVLCKLFDRSFNLLTLAEKTLHNHPMSTEKTKTALITSWSFFIDPYNWILPFNDSCICCVDHDYTTCITTEQVTDIHSNAFIFTPLQRIKFNLWRTYKRSKNVNKQHFKKHFMNDVYRCRNYDEDVCLDRFRDTVWTALILFLDLDTWVSTYAQCQPLAM